MRDSVPTDLDVGDVLRPTTRCVAVPGRHCGQVVEQDFLSLVGQLLRLVLSVSPADSRSRRSNSGLEYSPSLELPAGLVVLCQEAVQLRVVTLPARRGRRSRWCGPCRPRLRTLANVGYGAPCASMPRCCGCCCDRLDPVWWSESELVRCQDVVIRHGALASASSQRVLAPSGLYSMTRRRDVAGPAVDDGRVKSVAGIRVRRRSAR